MARLFNSLVKTIGRDFAFAPIATGGVTPPPPPPLSGSILQVADMVYSATTFGAIKSITDLEPYASALPSYGFMRYTIARSTALGGNKTITVPFNKRSTDGKLCQSAFYLAPSAALLEGSSTNIFNYGNDDHDSQAMRADGTGFIATSNTGYWQGTFSSFRANSEIATYSSSENVLGTEANNFIYSKLGHFISFPQSGAELWINLSTGQYLVPGFSMKQLPQAVFDEIPGEYAANNMWSISDGVGSFLIGRFNQSHAAYVELDLTNGSVYRYEIVYEQSRIQSNSTEEDANGTALFAINGKSSYHMNGTFYASKLDSSEPGWRFSNNFSSSLTSWPVGQSTQTDMDVFGSIDNDGYVWFADWGHDDGGLFNKGNDNTLGTQKTNVQLTSSNFQPPRVIFNSSTGPNNQITGGWGPLLLDGGNWPELSTSMDGVRLNSEWWAQGAADTVNNIDLTGAKSITIVVSSYSDSPYYYYGSFFYPNISGGLSGVNLVSPSDYNFSYRTVNIPVNDAGFGKIRLKADNSGSNTSSYLQLHSVVVNY